MQIAVWTHREVSSTKRWKAEPNNSSGSRLVKQELYEIELTNLVQVWSVVLLFLQERSYTQDTQRQKLEETFLKPGYVLTLRISKCWGLSLNAYISLILAATTVGNCKFNANFIIHIACHYNTVYSSLKMKQFLLIYRLLYTSCVLFLTFRLWFLTPILLFKWSVLTILSRLECMRLSKSGKMLIYYFVIIQ